MTEPGVVLTVSLAYLCLLFAIAYWGDMRADRGRSVIGSPTIYALSIAVYCTSWTFYGSVGRAAGSGIGFLPIYLGPTLMFVLGWFVLRKIVRISKVQRITSIADFIASRYGKSQLLGGLVTVIAVVGIMPYITLQLKAVSSSFHALTQAAGMEMALQPLGTYSILQDTAFHVAVVMAVFAILFGTRHIDATEHHQGMVAAVAFESVVKLVAFMVAGAFITFLLFDGFGDIFSRAMADPDLARLFRLDGVIEAGNWLVLMLISMAAIICLPRQFQVTVVENVDERHLRTAIWLFPLYLFLINLFVLPIAFGGLLLFGGTVDTDTFVLALPLAAGWEWLALLAFIGGLSAATGMIIVETIALSTMICNDLIMPLLLRIRSLRLGERSDVVRVLLTIRRLSIVLVLLLGYLYLHLIGANYPLVTIGLMSFAAAAQFAPAILGGIYWKGATRRGALAGLAGGFVVWLYTLLLPSFTGTAGWLPDSFLTEGPWGIAALRPYTLFGMTGLDSTSHSVFWSLLVNIGLYVGVSLVTRQSAIERIQAAFFVEVFRQSGEGAAVRLGRGTASVADLSELAARFIGRQRTDQAFADYARAIGIDLSDPRLADARLVRFTERLLAGAIGAASARVMVASVVKGAGLNLDEVMEILDETQHVIEYSHQLEQKSRQLEAATQELQAANERLKELDRMKDDFLSTVTHELRTPLTSIRSFLEILHDNPDLPREQRLEFLQIVIKESERLTRLINQVLDFARIEAGRFEWQMSQVDMREVVEDALVSMSQMFRERRLTVDAALPERVRPLHADRDQVMQVMLNLLSNAAKFCDSRAGRVAVRLVEETGGVRVEVSDNGAGIAPRDQMQVFDKFFQAGNALTDKPQGSGLGLPISRRIVEHLGGRIWVESEPGQGATFCVFLPFPTAVASA